MATSVKAAVVGCCGKNIVMVIQGKKNLDAAGAAKA